MDRLLPLRRGNWSSWSKVFTLSNATLTESSRSSSNRDKGIRGRIRVTWLEEKFLRRPLNLVFSATTPHRLLASTVLLAVHRNLQNDRRRFDRSDKAKNSRYIYLQLWRSPVICKNFLDIPWLRKVFVHSSISQWSVFLLHAIFRFHSTQVS